MLFASPYPDTIPIPLIAYGATSVFDVLFFYTECPAEQPEFGAACSLLEAAQCPYGEECCCGQCHPKLEKFPKNISHWKCLFLHALTMWEMPPKEKSYSKLISISSCFCSRAFQPTLLRGKMYNIYSTFEQRIGSQTDSRLQCITKCVKCFFKHATSCSAWWWCVAGAAGLDTPLKPAWGLIVAIPPQVNGKW